MNNLDIGTSLVVVIVACTWLTWLTTGVIALGQIGLMLMALDRIAWGRIALLRGWASHRGGSRKIARVARAIAARAVRGGAVHRVAVGVDWRRTEV